MRTELTYAVDQMARFHGDYGAASSCVGAYRLQGGLSWDYFRKVIGYMLAINFINKGKPQNVNPRKLKRIIKAMRKRMPRVHTEASTWRLTYHDYLSGAFAARRERMYVHARLELRCARSVRERYL